MITPDPSAGLAPRALKILFVGNSFTHGHTPPAQFYNAGAITDANGLNYGGVPGIFQWMASEVGFSCQITLEATCGQTLLGHWEKKRELIAGPAWDIVILQELSMRPLPVEHGGEPELFFSGARHLAELVRLANPAVQIFLYETWASPTGVRDQGYGNFRAMQADLRAAIFAAQAWLGLAGVVRVGEAFLQAVEQGVATPGASQFGAIDLWAEDARHASAFGTYLAAAVFFAQITGADPRDLPAGADSAAADLGLNRATAEDFHHIAFDVANLKDSSDGKFPIAARFT